MFRTEIKIPENPFRIDHETKILTLGSCFAGVMGKKLFDNKFTTLSNPFGVIFNPFSIFKLLKSASRNQYLDQDTFIERDGTWYNFDFHSEISATSKNELSGLVNKKIKEVHDYLSRAQVIIITLGTSFVYRLLPNYDIVANCHKIPGARFTKAFLDADEIFKDFESVYQEIKKINPDIKFILTVSPVRHIKDTLQLNALSKSILRLACHKIEQSLDATYFPSYEIMMDDLRDYRFYKEDMIHPTAVAEQYIWEKFMGTYMNDKTKGLVNIWTSLSKSLSHKPFLEGSTAHQKFLKETIQKLKSLENDLNLKAEIKSLQEKLL